jgi:hypothetical protein
MTERLFGRGRRGGVLLIAGAVLGAAVAGPGATIAQKAMNLTTKTADQRYVKRAEVAAVAAQTAEAPLTKFTSATFSPVATATLKAPGPGTIVVNGTLSAKDDADATQPGKLQYRLTVGGTPLTSTPEAYELFLPNAPAQLADSRQNGTVNGIARVARKGPVTVNLEVQNVAPSTGVDILGRTVTAQFVPKAKVAKAGKKKKTTGGGGGEVRP